MELIFTYEKYTLNYKILSCSCPDYKFRRKKLPKNHIDKGCKHLNSYIENNKHIISEIIASGGIIPVKFATTENLNLIKYGKIKDRIPLKDAFRLVENKLEPILSELRLNMVLNKYDYTGSLRRKMDSGILLNEDTIGDVDIIYHGEISVSEIVNLLKPDRIKSGGDIKSTFYIDDIQIDITRIEEYRRYYFQLLHATGSKYHNIKMSTIALSYGISLNEYGFYNVKTKEEIIFDINSERDIFNILKTDYVSPKNR